MSSNSQLNKIAVYTSGGDAPGMNAAIRAAVRTASAAGLEVLGVRNGYNGMMVGDFVQLTNRSVANIIQRGGTFLKAGRSPQFVKPEGRRHAIEHLRQNQVQGLVCIGGDGSFRGAHALYEETGLAVVGVPGTIDNDISGTDLTIGFDTAVNTALDAIDKIRDTAASHDRLFIVEVMGRDSGFIALHVGLAGGAEEILIPENPISVDHVIERVAQAAAKGKDSSIFIAAEGQKPGRAYDLAEAIRKKSGQEAKVCILGHIQRGGSPTATDRILASRLGAAGVEALVAGASDVMVGISNGEICQVPLAETFGKRKPVSRDLIRLGQVLSQ